jgi:hypothetical protein
VTIGVHGLTSGREIFLNRRERRERREKLSTLSLFQFNFFSKRNEDLPRSRYGREGNLVLRQPGCRGMRPAAEFLKKPSRPLRPGGSRVLPPACTSFRHARMPKFLPQGCCTAIAGFRTK